MVDHITGGPGQGWRLQPRDVTLGWTMGGRQLMSPVDQRILQLKVCSSEWDRSGVWAEVGARSWPSNPSCET